MMKTLKKALSVFLAISLLACLCIGMGMTGYAAGETITAEAVGTYDKSDVEQDVTIRISITGLSEPYCGFYIDGGVTLPNGWTLKSYSTSNTAQSIGDGDYNTDNGMLNYATSNTSDSIPANTYYDAVITAPAGVSGDFSIVFQDVYCAKNKGLDTFASAATVTANVTIKGPDPDPDPTPDPNANGYTVTVKADKTTVATGETVQISLDVANSVSTVTEFYVIDLVLTYDSANFTYVASSSTLPSGLTANASNGTLTVQKYGDAIALKDGAEFKLAFTAGSSAAENCEFKVTKAKIDLADHAYDDATDAAVSGTPKVSVSQTYTVTYKGNGATGGTAPAQDPVTAGTQITLPAANAFTREGYTFTGWLCSADNEVYDADVFYTMTAANTTFTAQWSKNYTVTYDINGATGTTPTQAAVPAGTPITLPAATAFTYDGYTFAGWKCDVDNKTYNASTSYTITDNTTFTAQWTETATATASIVAGYLDGYTLIKVTVTGDTDQTPTYDNNTMFELSGSAYDANAYYYIVKGTIEASTAQGKLGWSDSAATSLTKDGDANQTGRIDINDAQFIYNLYNDGITVTYTPTAAQLLASDVNGDGKVGTDDCAAAIDKIQ